MEAEWRRCRMLVACGDRQTEMFTETATQSISSTQPKVPWMKQHSTWNANRHTDVKMLEYAFGLL